MRERERDPTYVGSLSKRFIQPGLSQDAARSLELHPGPPMRALGAQTLGLSSAAFPDPLAGSWIQNGAAGT